MKGEKMNKMKESIKSKSKTRKRENMKEMKENRDQQWTEIELRK